MIFGVALPTAREWLFSAKTFAASMLALYVALAAGMPRPYWAMASVFIVANPFSGATRSKALYRLAGTCAGAAAAVFFVPLFVGSPLLLSAVVSVWTGGLLFVSFLDRTPRSYAFMLAGYSMPLIALPAVGNPAAVFDLAVARSQEIGLAILCASLVNTLIMPGKVGPVIGAQVAGWLADARGWIGAVLTGKDANGTLLETQRLAADVRGLDALVSQLRYDPEMGAAVRHSRDLRARMAILPPLLSSLADRLAAVRRADTMPRDLARLCQETAAWIDVEGDIHQGTAIAENLRARLAALATDHAERTEWHALLIKSAIARVRDIIDLWQDCVGLRDEILAGSNARRRHPLRLASVAAPVPHYDFGLMIFSAVSVVAACFLACVIWIVSGWDQGAGFVIIGAVACSFFATADNPAPLVKSLTVLTGLSAIIAGVYLFGILPAIHSFPGIVAVFAPTFLAVGVLMTRPKHFLMGTLLAVNTATLVSVQEVYSADFTTYVNSSIASVGGGLFALVWVMATRPFGAGYAARRLVRSGWAEIAEFARGSRGSDPQAFAGRVFDRLGQLVPRLAQGVGAGVTATDILVEMRVGLNVLDLRRTLPSLPKPLHQPIERVLENLAAGFADQARRGQRRPAAPTLLTSIDEALAASLAMPPGDSRTAAMQALVGLRLGLFPEAPDPDEKSFVSMTPPAPLFNLAAE